MRRPYTVLIYQKWLDCLRVKGYFKKIIELGSVTGIGKYMRIQVFFLESFPHLILGIKY